MQSDIYYNKENAIAPDTDRELETARSYMEGLPPVNIAALFLPPIWGPAKGIWVTILWYPLWLFADNCLFAWYSLQSPLATGFGIGALVLLTVVTFAFAYFSAPYAAILAIRKGKTKKQFQRAEKIWAVCAVIGGLLLLGLATYYNLCVRAPLVA